MITQTVLTNKINWLKKEIDRVSEIMQRDPLSGTAKVVLQSGESLSYTYNEYMIYLMSSYRAYRSCNGEIC